MTDQDDAPKLDPREDSRLQRRDRKRITRMVIDNAGVKRVTLALQQRAARKRNDKLKDR